MIVDLQLTIDGLNIEDCSDIDKFIDEIQKIAATNYDIQYTVLGVDDG